MNEVKKRVASQHRALCTSKEIGLGLRPGLWAQAPVLEDHMGASEELSHARGDGGSEPSIDMAWRTWLAEE